MMMATGKINSREEKKTEESFLTSANVSFFGFWILSFLLSGDGPTDRRTDFSYHKKNSEGNLQFMFPPARFSWLWHTKVEEWTKRHVKTEHATSADSQTTMDWTVFKSRDWAIHSVSEQSHHVVNTPVSCFCAPPLFLKGFSSTECDNLHNTEATSTWYP